MQYLRIWIAKAKRKKPNKTFSFLGLAYLRKRETARNHLFLAIHNVLVFFLGDNTIKDLKS